MVENPFSNLDIPWWYNTVRPDAVIHGIRMEIASKKPGIREGELEGRTYSKAVLTFSEILGVGPHVIGIENFVKISRVVGNYLIEEHSRWFPGLADLRKRGAI